MGNKGSGGPFAPLVVVVRNVVGEKDFNKLRGKAISLHSQSELMKPLLLLGHWHQCHNCLALAQQHQRSVAGGAMPPADAALQSSNSAASSIVMTCSTQC